MKFAKHCFGMFAKYWQPGNVKTRLAAGIGQVNAAAVYKAFLDCQVARFANLYSPLLAYSPNEHESQFQELVGKLDAWSLQSQGQGDLGERMQNYFTRAFANGFERATLVGSDTPTLPLPIIKQADALLRLHDVILGPTEDGGYYLVAAKQKVPPIFSGIEWSSTSVWGQTIRKLQQHKVRFAVLPTWYDVDDVNDLHRLQTELASTELDAATSQLQERLSAILASP